MPNELYEIESYVGTGAFRFGMTPAETHETFDPDSMVRFLRFAATRIRDVGRRTFPMIRLAGAVASLCCFASLLSQRFLLDGW